MQISETYLIDCLEYMKNVPDKFFELAVVDPDYGLGDLLTKGGWSAKYKNNEGRLGGKPEKQYFDELFRVSQNQIIWGGNYFELPPNRCFLIWDKVAQMDSLADCEYAWTSFNENAKTFRHIRNTSEKRIHITQKPISLYKWILSNYAKQGDKIFDSHLGSQSSRIAAYEMGFDFWGCELDEEYFTQGNARFETFKAQQKMFTFNEQI